MEFSGRFYHHMGVWIHDDVLWTRDDTELLNRRTTGWAWALSDDLSTLEELDSLTAKVATLAAAREWVTTADSPPCSAAFADFVDQALSHSNVDWTHDGMMDVLHSIIGHLASSLAFVRAQRIKPET
jgi:hypothetical protein